MQKNWNTVPESSGLFFVSFREKLIICPNLPRSGSEVASLERYNWQSRMLWNDGDLPFSLVGDHQSNFFQIFVQGESPLVSQAPKGVSVVFSMENANTLPESTSLVAYSTGFPQDTNAQKNIHTHIRTLIHPRTRHSSIPTKNIGIIHTQYHIPTWSTH